MIYGVLIITSGLLLLHWTLKWLEVKEKGDKELTDTSKKYDIQFKRLAKYFIFLFFLYIIYGIFEFQEKNRGYYLNKITVSSSFISYGYSDTALKIRLQELKEQIYDYAFRSLPTKRYALETLSSKDNENENINLQVQGFGFPLKNIGYMIAEKIWGDNKKYINIVITEDSAKLSVTVNIKGEPVKIFENYFESGFSRQLSIDHLLEEVEYYILESTDPRLIAMYYQMTGDYPKALSILSKGNDTVITVANRDIVRFRSLIYNDLKNYDASTKLTDSLLGLYPNTVMLLNDRGGIELGKGNQSAAQIYYDKALMLDSNAFYPCQNKSIYYYYQKKNIDSAILFLKRALGKYNNPSNLHNTPIEVRNIVQALFMLSYVYREKADLKNSEFYFNLACNSSPHSYEMVLSGWGSFPYGTDGKDYFKKVQELFKKQKNHVPAIFCYALLPNIPLQEAEKLTRECLLEYPKLIPAQVKLAELMILKKEPNFYSSDSILSIVLSNQPYNYIAYFLKGLLEIKNNNFLRAETFLARSLEINKFYEPSYTLLIASLLKQERTTEALSICQKYIRINPYNQVCNFTIGHQFYLEDNFSRAVYYLEKAEKYPTGNQAIAEGINNDIWTDLAYCYFELNNFQEAAIYYSRLLQNERQESERVRLLLKMRACYIQTREVLMLNMIENELDRLQVSYDKSRTLQIN